ncbi:MAG: GntR family transcriptional regulator YhfZ [Ktedonobacteraceae bacterium]
MARLDTEDFLSQTGRATVGVARLLLQHVPGEKLPRMMDIARVLKTGNGTIQEAFTHLTRLGAIVVETHGSRGSDLIEIDYTMLWRYAGNEWIIGSMPLPYTPRYEGLATALYTQLASSELPFNMTYQHGALLRGEMVRKEHYHYAVMSLLSAEHLCTQHPEMAIIAHLSDSSYVSEHVLVSRVPREQIRRIGVDLTSLDVMLLTDEEIKAAQTWEKIPITGMRILDLLQEGQFDALIWSRDGIPDIPENLTLLPLEGDARKRKTASQAAILALKNAPVRHVLTALFSPEQITLLQQEVTSQQKLPRY